MGRVGAACDNAAMESFFSLLQKNVLDTRRWETREELRPRDRHLDRNQVQPATTPTGPRQAPPVEFEMIYTTADAGVGRALGEGNRGVVNRQPTEDVSLQRECLTNQRPRGPELLQSAFRRCSYGYSFERSSA